MYEHPLSVPRRSRNFYKTYDELFIAMCVQCTCTLRLGSNLFGLNGIYRRNNAIQIYEDDRRLQAHIVYERDPKGWDFLSLYYSSKTEMERDIWSS